MGRRLLLLLAVLGSLLVGSPIAAVSSTPPDDCVACGGCCCCAAEAEGCGCLAPAPPPVPSSVVRVQTRAVEVPGCVRPALRQLVRPPVGPVVLRPTPRRAPVYPPRAQLLLEQLALPPPA